MNEKIKVQKFFEFLKQYVKGWYTDERGKFHPLLQTGYYDAYQFYKFSIRYLSEKSYSLEWSNHWKSQCEESGRWRETEVKRILIPSLIIEDIDSGILAEIQEFLDNLPADIRTGICQMIDDAFMKRQWILEFVVVIREKNGTQKDKLIRIPLKISPSLKISLEEARQYAWRSIESLRWAVEHRHSNVIQELIEVDSNVDHLSFEKFRLIYESELDVDMPLITN